MIDAKKKRQLRYRRHRRLRKKVSGTAARPRLAVYKSLRHFYAQAIDDISGSTLVSASSRTPELRDSGGSVDTATAVAEVMAEKFKAAGISSVVFDHGGFGYRGKIKAFADKLREKGM